jgi:RNA polymerase sigma factor (sigma-70 family)
MTGTRPAEILRQLGPSGEPDAELLARFATTKDAGAFAELVRRHGPLVLGVCRRVTGHPQDAEDAFQATFLVLAKKAGTLRNAALLGNWLYGVAYRVAWRAKRSALRRKRREVAVSALPDVPAPPPSPVPELGPILDEEVAALPAHYRDAIVLCDLRGVSREEAAAALGIPEGTLSSRLATGRKRLAARLTKRGIVLSAATLPAAISEAATAAVPSELLTKTCGLVADLSAGGAVPGPLARLAHGGFSMRKAFLLVAVMALAAGGAVLAARSAEDPPPKDPLKPPALAQKPEPAPQPKEQSKPGEKSEEVKFGAPTMRLATDVKLVDITQAAFSPDGRFLALQGRVPEVKGSYAVEIFAMLPDRTALLSAWNPAGAGDLVGFTPDSRELITAKREYQLVSGHHWLRFESLPDDVETALRVAFNPKVRTVHLDLPETYRYAFAPDGKTFRTIAYQRGATGEIRRVEILEVDAATGKARKSLLKVEADAQALSANGKLLATFDAEGDRVSVYDVNRGTKLFASELADPAAEFGPQKHIAPTLALSPDGGRLLIARGPGRTYLLDPATGAALPMLKGTKEAGLVPRASAFTGDGRLLASLGTRYKVEKIPTMDGQGVTRVSAAGYFLTVWDTRTGKMVKTWDRGERGTTPRVLFHPSKPVLAILESNGESQTRLGLWDFSAEVEKK